MRLTQHSRDVSMCEAIALAVVLGAFVACSYVKDLLSEWRKPLQRGRD